MASSLWPSRPLARACEQQRPRAAAVEVFLALHFFRSAAGFELVVLISGLDQVPEVARVIQRALGVGLVALMQQSGGHVFQHLHVVGLARQHAFADIQSAAVIVQVDGGLHQRALQFGSPGRIGILLQMIFDRQHELASGCCRLRSALSAGSVCSS